MLFTVIAASPCRISTWRRGGRPDERKRVTLSTRVQTACPARSCMVASRPYAFLIVAPSSFDPLLIMVLTRQEHGRGSRQGTIFTAGRTRSLERLGEGMVQRLHRAFLPKDCRSDLPIRCASCAERRPVDPGRALNGYAWRNGAFARQHDLDRTHASRVHSLPGILYPLVKIALRRPATHVARHHCHPHHLRTAAHDHAVSEFLRGGAGVELVRRAGRRAGFFGFFFEIMLPMSTNILIVALILQVTGIWNDYLLGFDLCRA